MKPVNEMVWSWMGLELKAIRFAVSQEDFLPFYVVNVAPRTNSHFVVLWIEKGKEGKKGKKEKAKLTIYDPLCKKLTGPLVAQLGKAIRTGDVATELLEASVESISLKWQGDGWTCGFHCLWLLLQLLNPSSQVGEKTLAPTPPHFIQLCQFYLSHQKEDLNWIKLSDDMVDAVWKSDQKASKASLDTTGQDATGDEVIDLTLDAAPGGNPTYSNFVRTNVNYDQVYQGLLASTVELVNKKSN
jgi:hypothetical protein